MSPAHSDAGGGHAHAGCCIYQGDNFPKEYRNTLFTCNLHGNRLNNDGLERTATGTKGVRKPDFLFANDPWFRGICVKQGPDGGAICKRLVRHRRMPQLRARGYE